MLIHSAEITGSVQFNNTDVSGITNVAGFATTASVDALVVKTGSYASTSSVNELQSKTGSYATTSSVNDLQSVTGSYASTGSNQFNGNQSISGSITSNGTITAQTLVVQTVTSSIEFITGSTRNGSLAENTHQFTGSVFMSNSLGIGTSSPNFNSYGTALTLLSSLNYGGIEIYGSGSTKGGQIDFGSGNVRYASISGEYESSDNGFLNIRTRRAGTMTDAVRITSAGNVGIGTSSPNELLVAYGLSTSRPRLVVGQLTTSTPLYSTYNTQDTPAIEVNTSTTTGFAGFTMSNSNNTSGNTLGTVTFAAAGTSNGEKRGAIIGSSLESAATSSVTANLVFYTTSASSVAERMRITSGGNVGIGTTTPTAILDVDGAASSTIPTLGLRQSSGATAYGQIGIKDDRFHGLILRGIPASDANFSVTAGDQMSFYEYGADFRFYKKQDAVLTLQVKFLEGTIYASNTTVQSISDIRTKENITNSEQGLDVIDALRPVRFDFKEEFNEGRKNQLGFIAQEVEEIFPDAVSEWKNDNDGITYKTVGPGALIPVLVKAIQELKAEIDILKQQ